MKTYAKFLAALLAGSLFLAGCNTEPEDKNVDRAILKAGQQVSEEMVGWVAVPNSTPKVVAAKEKGLTYAVLSTHQYVPASMNSWVAMTPALFAKMTDIKVETKDAPAPEKWVLKPLGKSVPKDKDGWVAVPFSEPKIESSATKKALEMATLFTHNIIPKDMNGWVALDANTLAKVSEEYMKKAGPGAQLPKERK